MIYIVSFQDTGTVLQFNMIQFGIVFYINVLYHTIQYRFNHYILQCYYFTSPSLRLINPIYSGSQSEKTL